MQPSVSPTLICNQIGMGLTVINTMNSTTTTGNGYIRDGGRGGGGGASLSSPGGREYHGVGGRGRNCDNGGIKVRRKIVLRGITRGVVGRGYNNSPISLKYLVNLVIFVNGG